VSSSPELRADDRLIITTSSPVSQLRRSVGYLSGLIHPSVYLMYVQFTSAKLELNHQEVFRSKDINPTLLPPTHTWTHVPNPSLTTTELHDRIIPYLESININIPSTANLDLAITGNTWSRAARRKAKLGQPTEQVKETPIRITLELEGGKLEMKWTYGKDRADVESFWNSMLAKTGLIKRAGGEKRVLNPVGGDEDESRKVRKSLNEDPA
jgi:hypothetical protein